MTNPIVVTVTEQIDSPVILVDVVELRGEVGPGVAPGGVPGQALGKVSTDDYDTEWFDVATQVEIDAVSSDLSDVATRVSVIEALGSLATDAEITAAIASLSTVYQPLNAQLTSIAALSTTAYGRGLLLLGNQAALLNAIGPATETQVGHIELATVAEALAGVDTTRAVTPAGAKAIFDALGAQPLTSTTKVAVSSWTPAATDHNKLVAFKDQIAKVVVNLPLNSSVALPIGFRVEVANFGSTGLEILEATGVVPLTPTGKALRARSPLSKVIITKTATDEWYVEGDLADLAVGEKTFYEKLMSSAVLWLDADFYDGGAKWKNKGTGGSALDAQLGSTPVGWGAWVESGALNLNGVMGNYASAPDSTPLSVAGDLEVVLRMKMVDWTPASNSSPIGKSTAAGNQRSWRVIVGTAGTLRLLASADGITENIDQTASVTNPFTDGSYGWVKITLDVDNGAAGHTVKFYTAADSATEPSSWTQLGTDRVGAGVVSVFDSSAVLTVGAWDAGATNPLSGAMSRAIIRNGIAGTTVFDANFANVANNATSFTESSSNAATVTINRTAVLGGGGNYGTFIGNGALNLPGVANNNASAPDAPTLDITGDIELEWVGTTDWSANATSNGAIICKEAAGQRSYTLRRFLGAKTVQLVWTTDGSTAIIRTSTVHVPVGTNGIKVTLDVDNGASGHDVKFYTSSNFGASYTQLGTTVTTASVTSIFSGTGGITIGQGPVSGVMDASACRRAVVRNGIGGTTVFDANFSIQPDGTTSFRESSSNAAVVTVNSTYNDANDPLFLRGSSTGYVYCPGTAGNSVSASPSSGWPATTNYQIVGDAEVPIGSSAEVAGWNFASGTGFTLYVSAAGGLFTGYVDSGSVGRFDAFSGSIAPALGRRALYRVTHTVSSGVFSGEYSLDGGSTWTSAGTTTTPRAMLATAPTSTFGMGWLSQGIGGAFKAYGCQWIVDGVTRFAVDFSTLTEANQSTFVCQTGQTVTFNRSATGRKLVVMPAGGKSRWLYGADDYKKVFANLLVANPWTFFALRRSFGRPASFGNVLTAGWAATGGVVYTSSSDDIVTAVIKGATANAQSGVAAATNGTLSVVGMQWDGTNVAPISKATIGSGATPAGGMMVQSGSDSVIGNQDDAEYQVVALFNRALTNSELSFISARNEAAA